MRSRLLVVGLLIVAAVGYLAYSSFQGATLYYLSPSEAAGQMTSLAGRTFRLAGKVAEGSVAFDPATSVLTFAIADAAARVGVTYSGAAPDNFAAGQEVVVEGTADGHGGLAASRVIVKCPSKYEGATASTTTGGAGNSGLLVGLAAVAVGAGCVLVAGRLLARRARDGGRD